VTRLWPNGARIVTWGHETMPAGFVWQGTSHQIAEVCNRWRVHTGWWEPGQAVSREYLKVATNSGFLCQVYRDLCTGQWFLTRLYD
jgi:hypothetical protein